MKQHRNIKRQYVPPEWLTSSYHWTITAATFPKRTSDFKRTISSSSSAAPLPPPPSTCGARSSRKQKKYYYYNNQMSTKTQSHMPTYTATMTILSSLLCPLEWRHVSTRIQEKEKPGMSTPSKGGCLAPLMSIIVAGACGCKRQEQQGYQAWYFLSTNIFQTQQSPQQTPS